MDAPCVEDLNPSRNFHAYFSILLATYLTITYGFQFLLESKITTTQETPKQKYDPNQNIAHASPMPRQRQSGKYPMKRSCKLLIQI